VRRKDGIEGRLLGNLQNFFATIQGEESGFKGYIILENNGDSNETIIGWFIMHSKHRSYLCFAL